MLSKFHKNIIIFFCVLLIFISIIFYRNFIYLIQNTSFPRFIDECPQHWNKKYDATSHICIPNKLNLGETNGNNINLTEKTSDGVNKLTKDNEDYKLDIDFDFKNVYKKNNYCGLYEYSKNKNLRWSGITDSNYVKYC
tara:strand:+ start:270 stop:683 length:414 start_codon:yes stop_codon:yes gene_type:complete